MTAPERGIPPHIKARGPIVGTLGPHCPECDGGLSIVLDSRPLGEARDSLKSKSTRRRRVCTSCEARWTTFEISEHAVKQLDSRLLEWVLRLELLLESMPGRRMISNPHIREFAESLPEAPARRRAKP